VLLVGSYLADSVVKRFPINGNWQPMALDKGIGHVYSPRNRIPFRRTVIRFLKVSAKFGTCTVMSVNETRIEDKMRRFKGECAHFSFKKCPIYTHDGASAKFSTNSHETDYSALPNS
jgi:hypothetical protein